MYKKVVVLAILITIIFISTRTYAEIYYVSKNGNDGNTGIMREQAFKTINRGVRGLKPGDTLIIGPGIYAEQVKLERKGTPDLPITIRSQFPRRAQLIGSTRLTAWAQADGLRYTFKTQLERETSLVYEKDSGVEYSEVAGVDMVENLPGTFFYDPVTKLLYVHPSDDSNMDHHVVDASLLDYGFTSSGEKVTIDHTQRSVGIIIDGFVISGYSKGAISIQNADFCEVRNCVVHHNRSGIFFHGAFRSSIMNCEAYHNADRFNQEMGNIGIMGLSAESMLENNIVHDTRQYGLRFYGGFYGNTMRNNLAYRCAHGIQVKGNLYDLGSAQKNFRFVIGKSGIKKKPMEFEGNVGHDCTGWSLIPFVSVARRNTGIRALPGKGPSELNLFIQDDQWVNAQFVDPAWHDFRLQYNSPYRSSGREMVSVGAFQYRDEVFFISPTGNDSAAGTSIQTAWKNLGRSCARLKAGQTLYVLPGIYPDTIELKGLRSKNLPTIIRAHGKGVVVIDGGAKRDYGISLKDCDNIVVEGFRVRGSAIAGIKINTSTNIILRENYIYDNLQEGVFVGEGTDGVRVSNNVICYNGGSGVMVIPSRINGEIVSNIIRDNALQLAFSSEPKYTIFCDYNNLGGVGKIARIGSKQFHSLQLWRSDGGTDEHSNSVDPQFSNEKERDFLLLAESKYRGLGFMDTDIGPGEVIKKARILKFIDVRVVGTSATIADIAWKTNGRPATLLIAYGTRANKLDNLVVLDTGHFYRTEHKYTITGLQPQTQYFFKVGDRRILEGDTPFHHFNYSWPELGMKGEQNRYERLKKEDTFDTFMYDFVTPRSTGISGRIYHVSIAGDDANDGNMQRPFRSIWRACKIVQPGDRVVIHEGVYYESINPLRSGLKENPIIFEAAKGEQVVISGKRLLIPTGADLTNRNNIIIRGFFFREQSQTFLNNTSGAQVYVANASNITIERCVFDGRMQYIIAAYIYRSQNVIFRNNIVVSHWESFIASDNQGILDIQYNSFIGPTIHKLYCVRNNHVIIRNNVFDENLLPEKMMQYKMVLVGNSSVDIDYNCYLFESLNNKKRIIDYGEIGLIPDEKDGKRFAVEGVLDHWQKKFGLDTHSIMTEPRWVKPDIIKVLRSRKRGWPDRTFTYQDFSREDITIRADSLCAGKNKTTQIIGPDYSY